MVSPAALCLTSLSRASRKTLPAWSMAVNRSREAASVANASRRLRTSADRAEVALRSASMRAAKAGLSISNRVSARLELMTTMACNSRASRARSEESPPRSSAMPCNWTRRHTPMAAASDITRHTTPKASARRGARRICDEASKAIPKLQVGDKRSTRIVQRYDTAKWIFAPGGSDSTAVEEIQRQHAQGTHPHGQRLFVEVKAWRMVGRGRGGLLPLGGGAQEIEEARHHLLEFGEVLRGTDLGHHHGLTVHGLLQGRHRGLGQRWRVHGDRVGHRAEAHLGLGTAALGNVLGRVADALLGVTAHALVEGAQGAQHLDLVRDDVEAGATVDGADGHHGGFFADVELTAHHGLQAQHHLAGRHDGVDPGPGGRTVRPPALHIDVDVVGTGHQRPAAVTRHTERDVGREVQAVDGLHVLEHALLDHGLGAEAGGHAIGVGLAWGAFL